MDGVAALPPLRETHRRARARCPQALRPALPARPQPDAPHRPRRRAARRRHGHRDRPRPGRPDARAAARRRGAASSRSRSIRAPSAPLAELQAASDGRLRGDRGRRARRSIRRASAPPPRRIVANLPYNVSTPLLVRWLHAADDDRRHGADVPEGGRRPAGRRRRAPRTTAGCRCWPSMSARSAGCSTCRPPPSCRRPRSTSSVVRLTPRPAGQRLADLAPLERVTAAAFGQRRKMLRGVAAAACSPTRSPVWKGSAFRPPPGRRSCRWPISCAWQGALDKVSDHSLLFTP